MKNTQKKMIPNYCIILSIVFCLFANLSLAVPNQRNKNNNTSSIPKDKGYINKSSRLLDVLKWDISYEEERKRDATYLLGNIDGNEVKDLTAQQKKQVITLLQEVVITQISKDKMYFREYLMNQYNQFFTADELEKLIQYFNTKLMQTIIDARIKKDKTVINIQQMLIDSKEEERKVIDSMTNSYLYIRYSRFQEKISPIMQKMILERFKAVLEFALGQIPKLIDDVKNNRTIKTTEDNNQINHDS